VPSSVPTVKDGLGDFFATLAGPTVQVCTAVMDPSEVAPRSIILTDVTATQAWRGMPAVRRAEAALLVGWCNASKPGAGEDAIRAARAAVFALLAVIEDGLRNDPSAGGVIGQPRQSRMAELRLEEVPSVLAGNAPGRTARLQFQIVWEVHL
jgi:hypothetical protein